jgi:hypothetical protein
LFAKPGKLVFGNDTKIPNDPDLQGGRPSEVAENVFDLLAFVTGQVTNFPEAFGPLGYFCSMPFVVVSVDFSFFLIPGHFV